MSVVKSSLVAATALALGLSLGACARNNPNDLAAGYGAAGAGSVQEFNQAIGDRVFFDTDQTDLSPTAQATLDKQAAWLNKYDRYAFAIEGHADGRGTRNLALGARRAQAVHDYLVAKGVLASRMKTISYGKERPVATCDDESCWSRNRRAVTVLNGAPSLSNARSAATLAAMTSDDQIRRAQNRRAVTMLNGAPSLSNARSAATLAAMTSNDQIRRAQNRRAVTMLNGAPSLSNARSAATLAAMTSDDQIRRSLIGNTISGEENGKAYIEYFHPDGRISGKDRDGPYTGHWWIASAQICVRYAEEDAKEGPWDCSRTDVKGSKVIWVAVGNRSVSDLAPGNPYRF